MDYRYDKIMQNVFQQFIVKWALLGGIILIIIMGVTSLNVLGFALDRVARLLGQHISGLSGYEDFVRLSIACAISMFLPYCQLHKGHIVVDICHALFHPKFRQYTDVIYTILLTIFVVFLSYWMVIGMIENSHDNALSPILGWQIWLFYIPVIVSLWLWGFTILHQLFTIHKDS